MTNSILISTKISLGIMPDENAFDGELIIIINTILSTLCQIGLGPKEGIRIKGSGETWDLLIGDRTDCEMVKEYMAMRAKTMFDPSGSSVVTESRNRIIAEMEYRISVLAERWYGKHGTDV